MTNGNKSLTSKFMRNEPHNDSKAIYQNFFEKINEEYEEKIIKILSCKIPVSEIPLLFPDFFLI